MTGIFVLATVALFLSSWAGYDLWILYYYGLDAGKTISQVIWEASLRHPGIPFLTGLVVGLLCGHLFLA